MTHRICPVDGEACSRSECAHGNSFCLKRERRFDCAAHLRIPAIIAAALLAFCAPAWAGGGHGGHPTLGGGSAVGGTSASSASGFSAGGEGRSSASGTFSNKSRGSNKDGQSTTSSKSRGEGKSSKNAGWDGYSEGTAGAFTFGGFGRH